MDAKDLAKITHHSGQESHGVHICHKCGWPFPNPHPSAKHRRAHKRVCGTVEGYKLVHSEGSTHSAVSDDDEHPSDDDHKTPSPKIVESSKNGIGTSGIEERSNRMEDEVFSDAVAEFSDSGITRGIAQVLEDARESITNVEKVEQPLEDNSNADTIQPPGSLTDSSIMQIPGVPKSTNDCLESAIMSQDHGQSSSLGSGAGSISEDLIKESTLGLSGDGNDSACDLSAIKPEISAEAPQENYKTNAGEGIMECLLSRNIREGPVALMEKTDAMESEEKNLDRKLLEIAVSPNENAGERSEAGLKSEKTDEKTLDAVAGDVIVQSEEDQTDGIGPKISPTCISPDLKSVEQIDASADTAHDQVDSAQGTYSPSGGDLVEVCKAKGEENENLLVLDGKLQDSAVSTSEDARETSEVGSKSEKIDVKPLDPVAVDGIVEVQEDQSGGVAFKSSPRDLSPDLKSIELTDASAETACIQYDTAQGSYLVSSGDLVDSCKAKGEENEPVSMENHPGTQSRQLAGCTGASPSDVQAFEDNLKQDDVCRNPTVPVEGEAGVSEIKVVSCNKEHSRSEMGKNQTICSLEEQGPHNSSKESLEVQPENATMILPDTMVSPIDSGICQKPNLVDNNSGGDHEKARIENYDMVGSDITEAATGENLTENRKTASECVSDISNSQANQTINLLEGDSAGDLGKVKIETFEIAGKESTEGSKEENIALGGDGAGNHDKVEIEKCEITEKESREKEENIVTTTPEFASSLSESQVAAEDDMNVPVRNLPEPETEYKDLDEVSDPSRVGIDIMETHSIQCLGAVNGVAESNLDGEKLSQNSENLSMEEPKLKTGDFESSVQCVTTVEEDHSKMLGGEASGISSSKKEPMLLSGDAESPVQSLAAVEDGCTEFLAGDAPGISSSTKEPKPSSVDTESSVQSSTAVEDEQTKVLGGNASGIKIEPLQVEGDRELGILPLDVSIDSGSQTDSLEGNWGSVSGISIQSDVLTVVDTEALQPNDSKVPPKSKQSTFNKPKDISESHGSDKSDVFEPPSFATLVESGGGASGLKSASPEIQTVQSQQQPESGSSQAGWFPSLTNVVNESQGRKKNEEIIAKVTNWSTGKQHTPLKNLLVEANTEAKPKSPTSKESSASVIQKDEAPAKNGIATPPMNVNAIPGPEAPTAEPAKDLGKEWNSPARYPIDSKPGKRKVKGKPYWAPFVCCSSVN